MRVRHFYSDVFSYSGVFFCSCVFLFFLPLLASAQAIDNNVSFRNINSDHYFRINYENDFFTATDRDYSQGVLIEWVNPRLKRLPLYALLWHPQNSVVRYGLAVEDDTYTPNHFDKPEIQYGDRPFADALFAKLFTVAANEDRRERVVTQLSAGVIGPWAGGAGMQEGIHRWLHDITPHGWPNQVKNDLVLNYQLNYEREFLTNPDHFSLASFNSVRVGTLSDKLSTGLSAMAGNFISPFTPTHDQHMGRGQSSHLHYYVYDQLSVNLIGYDASLQGGAFNHSSPYTISDGQLNRVTVQNRCGIVLVLRKLYMEYYQTGLTAEFHSSLYHRTGGIQVGFGF